MHMALEKISSHSVLGGSKSTVYVIFLEYFFQPCISWQGHKVVENVQELMQVSKLLEKLHTMFKCLVYHTLKRIMHLFQTFITPQ